MCDRDRIGTIIYFKQVLTTKTDHVLNDFFFQAEDGIRDPLWSRGLGDVYKRQGSISASH